MIYLSKKKYGIKFSDTIEFIDKIVLPFIEIINIGLREYLEAQEYIVKYGLKSSDVIHIATIKVNGIHAIATEGRDFDIIDVKRLWV